jgi:nitrate reductase gamma subunit
MGAVFVQVLSWLCFLIFLVGIGVEWRRYARLPLHLRWDLHPLPKETIQASSNGGLPGRLAVIVSEVRFAFREGLLFEQCFKSNRGIWYATYPFHLGVFLSTLWVFLLFLSAITGLADWWPSKSVLIGSGSAGLVLGSAGCLGLLWKRLFDPNLRSYTTAREYLNLSFLLIVFLLGLSTWIGWDIGFSLSRQYAQSLVALSSPPSAEWPFWFTTAVFSVFLATLPFASMKHGIAKFFTYHQVRWDDKPNLQGSELEHRIQGLMGNSLTWSAPHVGVTKWQDVPSRGGESNR